MKRSLTSLLLILLAAMTLVAQISFRLKAPQRVRVGDKFPVTFVLRNAEGTGTGLKVPQINGCTLLYGPSTATMQSYEVVNGHMSSSSTIEYTYYYRADTEGTYTIGEASINADGKRLTTEPAKLTVSAGAQPQQPQGQSGSGVAPVDIDDIDTQSAGREVSANDVFVRIILSKSTAYEQEAIECTIKLYTKYSISQFFPTRQPSFDGFLIQELDVRPALNEVESYRGQNYMTAVLKKCIIFPQKSGKLTINSGNYDIDVVQYDNVNMGFFSVRTPQPRSIKVSSNSASIDIKPLPQPQPEGFSGAVGRFTAESRLVGNSFRTNEPATLIYTIAGTGNIKYIKEPAIDFPAEFEQYTPQSDIQAEPQRGNVTGRMTVEYTFVPQSVGDFKIGSDRFVYFDPSTREYVTIATPVYDIHVAKGVTTATTERKDVEAKNTDILHIHPSSRPGKAKADPVTDQWWYWLLYVLVIAAVAAAGALTSRHARRASDVTGTRMSKASKVARNRLRLAKKLADTPGSQDKFIEETLRAMWGYLGDKLGIPASQLTRSNISERLTSAGVPQAEIDRVIETLDSCEMARYAPSGTREPDLAIYQRASEAINSLESIKLTK